MSREDTAAINWKAFYYRLYVLAAPIAFQSLMLASVAAGDALMLGRVAQNEMTAVSLATQIQFVQNMFISAIAAAGAILAAFWTDANMPVIDRLGDEFLDYVKDGMKIEVKDNGVVEVE